MKPTMTRLSVAVLVSSTVLSTIVPTQSYAATYEGTVNTSILNVRSSTSTSSSIVGKLTQGTKVQVYSTSNNWSEINFNGQRRYVSSSYLTLKKQAISTSTSKESYITTDNLHLRVNYARTANIITTIPKNSKVEYISTHGANGTWYRIKFGTHTGYVAASYLTKTGLTTNSTTNNASLDSEQIVLRNTNMHTNFSRTAPIIYNVKKNEPVKVVSTHGANNTWYRIEYRGQLGYVAKADITKNELFVIKQAPFHSQPFSSSKILSELSPGTKVSYVKPHGQNGTWYEVKFGNTTGYMAKWNLSVDSTDVQPTKSLFTNKETNLHVSTISSSAIAAKIPKGAEVNYYSKHGANGTWFKISYKGIVGYSAAWDLSETPPPVEEYEIEQQVRVNVPNNATLNVRERATTDSKELGKLTTGTVVSVKPVSNTTWGLLTSGNLAGGYIHLSYTTPVTTTPPVTGIQRVVSHTSYPISLRTMAERQVAQFGQTDAYRNAPAYLPRAWVSVNGNTGTIVNNQLRVISGIGTALKMSASSTSTTLATIPNGTNIEYVDRQVVGTAVWYRVKYGSMTGFVTPSSVVGAANILSQPSLTSHAYGQINPGETVTITGQTGTYYTVSYRRPAGHNIRIFDNVWRRASVTDLEPFVNPNNFDQNSQAFYQFLDLSKSAGTTASTLNKVLVNTGTLTNQGQAFINAANQYSINEIYLLSHAVHETGHGKSVLAQGVPVDKDGNALINSSGTRIHPERPVAATVYNMYGIQAVDSSPLATGAKFAFEQKWFSPEAAIVGGAYWIGASYINHPTYKQNTLYKMRFNPANPGVHQYATDIGWATKQTARIYQTYQTLDSYTLHFDVPKFQ
ncbi:SH3 domain-containing protein [Exiguobacterium sp.]|uniref:SH3 domain-containing protein n=1 Tax=Exiguobacterium sp. TaxID=44751 RepID=UPI00263ADD2A|nr:SH3 domain-containing protein [Exiguobacterium sp.]MCC5891503.1 SH3 domain-containing protein [Exiguobacterium sp.]